MDKTLFNLHDLTLLVIAFECLAIVAYLALNKSWKNNAIYLLLGFFVLHAFISIHELVLWGRTFRYWVLEISPNLFFVLNISYWLDGPLLYLFIRSIAQTDPKLKKTDAFHLLPAALFCGFIYVHFYTLEYSEKVRLISDYSFADFQYVGMDLLAKLGRLAYLLMSLRLVLQYRKTMPESYSLALWLPKVLLAYGVILAWEVLLSGLKVYHSLFGLAHYGLVEFIGLMDYYALFVLISSVIFLCASGFSVVANQPPRPTKKEPVNLDFVKQLEQAMKQDKLFLNQYLSLERLAEKLNIPVKDLSLTINRHYNVNFYEFINSYRIEEARRLLADPTQSHRSITDIFYDAGFNSKSVYNTLFKKTFDRTPSQYRKQCEINHCAAS